LPLSFAEASLDCGGIGGKFVSADPCGEVGELPRGHSFDGEIVRVGAVKAGEIVVTAPSFQGRIPTLIACLL